MKKPKLTTICSLAITIYFLLSFIFIHADPIRVARRYTSRHGYFTETVKGTTELEYTSDTKSRVDVCLFYEDERISAMSLYKTKSGLWFISHIGI
jgi:hypothetical protein